MDDIKYLGETCALLSPLLWSFAVILFRKTGEHVTPIALNLFKGACIDQTALGIFMRRQSLAPNLLAIGTWVHLSAVKSLSAMVR